MENAHFMEQYYAQHKTFRKNSTTWSDLPHTATSKFDITFTAQAKDINKGDDRYILRATPNTAHAKIENRYIEIDQHNRIKLCTKNNSTECKNW